jgi:mannan endo-1,4-beta-mannosidase
MQAMADAHNSVRKPLLRCWFLTGIMVAILNIAGIALAFTVDTPVTQNASPEAQSLIAFLSDIYGKKTLSGQQEGWRLPNELSFELNYIQTNTGKLPAILGLDFSGVTMPERRPVANHGTVNRAIDWYKHNGIVTICWHWHAPTGKRGLYTKETDFDLRRGLVEGTPEYEGILRDIDTVAGELKLLQEAHVPVLWRPLHEMNGRWFWWGAQGAEPCRRLWQLMFDRLTSHHHLTNLIWVWSPGAAIDLADWYPGDAYVDIIGQDHYPMDGNHRPAGDIYDELVRFCRGTKLIGMSENGPIPDQDEALREKADWLFFVTWTGTILTEKNSMERLNRTYNHPRVLNLGDLPDLKSYPFKPAGDAVKLAFPSAPGDVAVNGLRRRPVTVVVQDSEGRTVRSGSVSVTLTLDKSSEKLRLAGTLTQPTVNGVATFADVRLSAPEKGCALIATSDGLSNSVSPRFQCGPGNGLVREWWNDARTIRLEDVLELTVPPAGQEPLLMAFEVPFMRVTNYVARFRGWLLPPEKGAYAFSIASDSGCELWLSTDASQTNRVRIARIGSETPYAKWPHTLQAKSEVIQLEDGKRYFIEVQQKQNAGSAHISLCWKLPNGAEERPIPAEHLMAFRDDSKEIFKR